MINNLVFSIKLTNYIKNMKTNKTIFQSLFLGLKKGWSTPTLPSQLLTLHNNVFIRFLRVSGGISIILIITHRLDFLGKGLLYLICLVICLVFSFIYSLYLIYINYHRIKHMYKTLKNRDLDIHT